MSRETCICETPEAPADLGLGQILLEAQPQDLPLALGQRGEQPVDDDGVLGAGEAGIVVGGDDVDRQVAVLRERAVERVGMVRAAGRDGLDDLLDRGVGALGELGDRGGASELAGQASRAARRGAASAPAARAGPARSSRGRGSSA